MDWSNVFEDEGEEIGDWQGETVTSTRTGTILSALVGANGNSYSPQICYAFTVNYILGVGCLGIPFAFLKSGIILATFLVVLLTFVSYMTVMWVAFASQKEIQLIDHLNTKNPFIIARHSTQKRVNNDVLSSKWFGGSGVGGRSLLGTSNSQTPNRPSVSVSYASIPGSRSDLSDKDNVIRTSRPSSPIKTTLCQSSLRGSHLSFPNFENGPVNGSTVSTAPSFSFVTSTSEKRDTANNRKELHRSSLSSQQHDMEVTDLVRNVVGPWGSLVYQTALMMLTYVGLLAYAQVFNSAFVSQICPQCGVGGLTVVPPLLFGAVVIPLSCFDLAEQITLQLVMSLLRFLSLGILLFGTLVAIVIDPTRSGISTHSSSMEGLDAYSAVGAPPLVVWSGFGVMFTTVIFSQLFQHSVPGLMRPLSKEDRKFIPQIFGWALITTSVIYISTGIACVVYFGDHLQHSVNLNFVDFDWGFSRNYGHKLDGNGIIYPLVRFCISLLAMTVVLFPALDTLSVFPLIANTLGNNLNSAFPFLRDRVTAYYRNQLVVNTTESTNNTECEGKVDRNSGVCSHHDRVAIRRITLTAWRLVAAVPPIAVSLAVTNLMFSLQLAGLCGIVVALITPALLQRFGRERYSELLPRSLLAMEADILKFCASDRYSNIVLILAILALVICILQMIS